MTSPLADKNARRRFNKAMREQGVAAKACGKCFVVKATAQFRSDGKSSDQRSAVCVVCKSAFDQARYARTREAVLARVAQYQSVNATKIRKYQANYRQADPDRMRVWRQANPDRVRMYCHKRRALKAAATIETFTARDMYDDWEEHDLYQCFYCAGPLDTLNIEHFEALDNGGPHALHNIVPSCRDCNLSKGTKEEWGVLTEHLAARGIDLDACLAFFDGDRVQP
ncbi:HNH endonuclease signature motif containing protein [Streptomyces sp. ITFR-6]|uniref:HNH endonuclease n=1 Tax=Streptomyces sp. ITFR-6 TaxID=3075197 RepID=UPI00288BF2C4|nr:HNH endonuclease signature motif containing protein [Streptomyces sp. ITFR-6]WNI28650.1 HNH endonuclease signature motif containing protein [Streptomyces sp. ITFR-6]